MREWIAAPCATLANQPSRSSGSLDDFSVKSNQSQWVSFASQSPASCAIFSHRRSKDKAERAIMEVLDALNDYYSANRTYKPCVLLVGAGLES